MYSFDTKKAAKFWRVSIRTVQNWAKAEHPVTDELAMSALIIARNLGGKDCLAVAQGIMLRKDGRLKSENDTASISSLDLGRGAVGVEMDTFAGESVDLTTASAYFWGKMKLAAKAGNAALETYYHERYLKNQKAIRDDELHAQRMGLDEGAIINRDTFERYVTGLAFWMVRGVESDLRNLTPLIVELPNQEVAWGVLDRWFLRKRFLAAFEKACSCDSGLSLPKWCFEDIRKAVDVFFEVDVNDLDDVAAYAAFEAAISSGLERAG